MKSLLNKNLIQFIGCMLVLLILVTPLFYLLTKNYYAEEMRDTIIEVSKGEKIRPSDLEQDIAVGMVLQFVLIFAVLGSSMLLVMRFLTKRLWRPFDDTLFKMEQFNLDLSDVPQFTKSDIKEFERLNRSIEKLIRKDKDTYNSQKEFTQNASHELQTPIAVIQSKLDLLMQENLNENQIKLVSDMYNICNRLSRLNKNLLLLAKIENSQYYDTEKVNLNDFMQKRLPLYSDINTGGNILLDIKSDEVFISANIPLLESMVNNLVVNAIRHKSYYSDIVVTLDNHSLTVINDGEIVEPLDGGKLFRRFSNNSDVNMGNGLGLSIVKAICDYHHWTVKYKFEEGKHQFIVTF